MMLQSAFALRASDTLNSQSLENLSDTVLATLSGITNMDITDGDDNYEKNDFLFTAYDLSDDEQTWLSSIDGLGVANDRDWYKIEVTPGYERLMVDLQFTHADGDIDLVIYDDAGNYVTGATSTTDNESIDYVLPDSGTYYIGVYPYSGSGNTYDLYWDDLLNTTDDNYESNNTLATAYDLSNNEQTWLSSINGLGVANDLDWYEIEVAPGYEQLMVDLQFTHADGNINLFVYDSAGNFVTRSASTTDNESIDYLLPDSGTYYIGVHSFSGNGNTYDLYWDDLLNTTDDNYESNNTLATAYDLSFQEQTWLSDIDGLGIANDSDWYEIEIDSGYEHLVVDLEFTDADGDIDLKVYDAAGNLVTSSASTTDNESINHILPSSGTYYLEVYPFSGSGNTYDLYWDDLPNTTDDLNATEDNYESNNTLATAYDLSNDEQTWLSDIDGLGIANDSDWYEIDITSGYEHLVVDLEFTDADGDIDLAVYDAAGNLVTSSTSVTDNESIDYVLPSSGTYYLEVYPFSGSGNTYDLYWDDLPNTTDDLNATEDNYEANNTLATAYDLSNDEQTWLSDIDGLGIANDSDWYEIDITSGFQQLDVDLQFTHANGDIDLAVYDAAGNYVTGSISVTDNESIDYLLPSSGTYYLEIYPFSGSGNTYDLSWDATYGA